MTKWRGRLTRTGDVTELLATDDDRHVICGPGDEVTAEFDASIIAAASTQTGSDRSCCEAGVTARNRAHHGDGRLRWAAAHRAMPRFPFDTAKEPLPAALADYDRIWNTRPAGGR